MVEYINKADAMAYPIRLNHYDTKNGNRDFVLGCESVLEYIDNLPTADVAPVIHAKWETVTVERARSVCGENPKIQYKRCGNCKKPMGLSGDEYCGTCGARMDLKEGENDGAVD